MRYSLLKTTSVSIAEKIEEAHLDRVEMSEEGTPDFLEFESEDGFTTNIFLVTLTIPYTEAMNFINEIAAPFENNPDQLELFEK